MPINAPFPIYNTIHRMHSNGRGGGGECCSIVCSTLVESSWRQEMYRNLQSEGWCILFIACEQNCVDSYQHAFFLLLGLATSLISADV